MQNGHYDDCHFSIWQPEKFQQDLNKNAFIFTHFMSLLHGNNVKYCFNSWSMEFYVVDVKLYLY